MHIQELKESVKEEVGLVLAFKNKELVRYFNERSTCALVNRNKIRMEQKFQSEQKNLTADGFILGNVVLPVHWSHLLMCLSTLGGQYMFPLNL